ncbi:MCE family protein [Mycolicibacterium helvum]|uniref:Mammalian cell entry protein n=1 Tax=Mycolicibacterium helvum TaxID=1534349 RepID=A0A7I7T849_9MYCO|nr:MCE family protein [Mycolicibacterium helvum]BBY64973.1 mammalian cell entry protein [Mycolicibacterium helvum]
MSWRRRALALGTIVGLWLTTGCSWHGLNSLALPGVAGRGDGSFHIQAQLPDVANLEPNSRVRVADVTVGSIARIERQGWHALVTIRLDGDVDLPENTSVKVAQTSLLGSLHIELAPPQGEPPRGRLHDGSVIPLSQGGAYPTTEQTLAAASMLLNGGGLAQAGEITEALSTAFNGREADLRGFVDQVEVFTRRLDGQTNEILAATDSINRLTGRFAARQAVLDRALELFPQALAILRDDRDQLVEALDQFGHLNALVAGSVNSIDDALIREYRDLWPVLEQIANAGPAVTESLSLLSTFPWTKEGVRNWIRGDFGNLTAIFDLTLSRLDTSLLTGTRFEGALTRLEMQWGRTVGVLPSPATGGNPLLIPYQADQGP